jgi:AraC-like DNA-binding protein
MSKSHEAVHMALTADDVAGHPGVHAAIHQQSRLLLQVYDGNPRLASVFGTQHRWLMAQVALALHFRRCSSGKGRGINSAQVLDAVSRHGVANRNTADAFLKEMLKYGFARQVPGAADKRTRPIEPTETSLEAIHGWIGIHLATLDRLDHGRRLETYLGTPDALAALHPGIADGLLSSARVRKPERTFSLFTWLNNGGLIMDWLIAGIEETDAEAERVQTGVVSIAALAQRLNLSRTHLSRKLRDAEALGSIGWQGKRGESVMWVSASFREEYAMAQAVKLAIIDAAFAECFQQTPDEAAPAMPKVPLPMTVTPSEAPALSAVEGRGL